MADLQTSVIDPSKIKVRWEEPYTSESVNRGLTTIPRGVYRGFVPVPAATPDKTFKLAIDPSSGGYFADSALLYVDRANGFALAVRDAAEPSFDMSARFTDAGGTEIPPAGEIWWVWADVDYSTGLNTTGAYHVTLDGDPIPDDAVYMGKVTMPGGATAIEQAYFSYAPSTDRTVPFPDKAEDGAYVAGEQYSGFLSGEEAWNIPSSDQKRGMNNAATPATASNPFVTKADSLDKVFAEPSMEEFTGLTTVTKIQLAGWYYVGNGPTLSAGKFFRLQGYSPTVNYGLEGSDDRQIIVNPTMLQSDGVTPLDPSADADVNGFYQNPWLQLDFSRTVDTDFTGSLLLLSFKKKSYVTLANNPVYAFPNAGMQHRGHVDSIASGSYSGTPDSLGGKLLGNQIPDILGYINDRVETMYPGGPHTNWKLVWRSQELIDANILQTTVSWYTKNGSFAVVVGAYFNATIDGRLQVSSDAAHDVSMLLIEGHRIVRAVYKDAGPGGWLSWSSSGPWTTYDIIGNEQTQRKGDTEFWNKVKLFTPDASFVEGGDASAWAGGLALLFESTESGAKTRVYYTASSGLMICQNCWWDEAGGPYWSRDDGAKNAYRLWLSDEGLKVSMRYNTAGDVWVEGNWTTDYDIRNQLGFMEAFPTIDGDVTDVVYTNLFGYLPTGLAPQALGASTPVQWHSRLNDIVTGDVTFITSVSPGDPGGYTSNYIGVSSVTEDGCMLDGISAVTSPGNGAQWVGWVIANVVE